MNSTLINYRNLIENRFKYIRNEFQFVDEECCDFNIANEIVAYLITLNFNYSNKIEFGYNNLSNFYACKMQKYDLKDKEGKVYINDFRKLQRREEKLRRIYTNHQTYLKNKGFKVLPVSFMETEQKGRIYDLANLEFIFQRRRLDKAIDLFDLTVSNMICSSKSVSDRTLIETYDALNYEYAEAKETKNKAEYIFKWINFYRMETSMRFSLIYKIADFAAKNKSVNKCVFSCLSDVWGTRYFEDGYIAPPFQILRHEKFIKFCFSAKTEEELFLITKQAEKERILESILVRYIEDEAKGIFMDFTAGNEAIIDEVYNFCRYEYPVIENYEPANFYLDEDCEMIDKRKIKIIRKTFKYLLKPEELKKLLSLPKNNKN